MALHGRRNPTTVLGTDNVSWSNFTLTPLVALHHMLYAYMQAHLGLILCFTNRPTIPFLGWEVLPLA